MPKNNMDFQQFASQVQSDRMNFGAATSPITVKPTQLASFNRRKPKLKIVAWIKEYRIRRAMVKRFNASQADLEVAGGDGEVIVYGFFIIFAVIVLYTTFNQCGMN
jgi:hypothetical protein